jgi:hypothetical protein
MAVIFEERLIYFPSDDIEVTPEALGLRHDDLVLETSDGQRIHAWFLPSPVEPDEGAGRYTVLMCHGNAGNISHRLDRAVLMHSNLATDVLLFDYRGFGKSSGSPNEPGTYDDARTAYRYLVDERRVSPERVVLFGESLGAAVALQLATEVDAAGLVLEAPFTSIRDMAKAVYPFVPNGWVRTRYENVEKIPALEVPLLVIHGTEDPTVPFAQGKRLFEAAPEPKRLLPVEGAGHSDNFLVGRDVYWPAWQQFLASLNGNPRP